MDERMSLTCTSYSLLTFILDTFEINRERAIDYLNTRENVYVFDGYAGVRFSCQIFATHKFISMFSGDPKYRIKGPRDLRASLPCPLHGMFSNPIFILRLYV